MSKYRVKKDESFFDPTLAWPLGPLEPREEGGQQQQRAEAINGNIQRCCQHPHLVANWDFFKDFSFKNPQANLKLDNEDHYTPSVTKL